MKYYCSICKGELKEQSAKLPCSFCNKEEEADWVCSNNHFQCEVCRVAEPAEIILRVTNSNLSTNPFVIANLIMHHPTFRNHGAEHHLIVAPAVLTALNNASVISVPKNRIKTALKRTLEIPYGTCGSRGDCGASVGAGVATSIITRATYRSDKERSLVLKATGLALIDLAEKPGPRCCKQSVYSAIESVLKLLNSKGIISYSIPNFKCEFKDMDGCKKELCSYYAI
ncbi:MAG TPA: DUF5714 domain-containing protein [Candidatus Bathyarchaeia archaeon]|nr:DUF5714 domain-containing protein [Candidatus Bathyarchaeia archaeon]